MNDSFHALMGSPTVWIVASLALALIARHAWAGIRNRLDLAQSEHRAIFNSTFDSIFMVGDDGVIQSCNPAAGNLFGCQPEELAGRDLGSMLSGAGENTNLHQIDHLLKPGSDRGDHTHALLVRRKDDSVIRAEGKAIGITGQGGRRIMLLLRDVSQQMAAEKELLDAREAAEAATRAKPLFLAELSHEIRSPMNSIIGVLDLLQNSPLGKDQARYLHLAQESASALLALVNDILDLSRIDSGQLTLEAIPFSLPLLLEQLVQLPGNKARQKGLELKYAMAGAIPGMICGDPMRLRQVLVNLLDNAIKFTDEGEIELHVFNCGEKEDPCALRFEVTDTGGGIPDSLRQAIFTPYCQAALSGAGLRGGTGLGLTISHRLVELMGGEIGYTSAPGQGSMFWFTVIFNKAEPASNDMPEPMPQAAEPPQGSDAVMAKMHSRKQRVLVVDDSEMNRIPCREMLKKLGVDVATANDGLQALEAMANSQFDLVLMDCRMPEMDGYEASRRIRAMEKQKGLGRTPIIALTANAMEGDREASLAAGMDDHLNKPFRFTQLESLLETWLPGGSHDPNKEKQALAGSAHLPFYGRNG